MSVRRILPAALTFVVAVAAAGTAAAVVIRRPAPRVTLAAGDPIPIALQPAVAASRGRARHLILYSTNCAWCARQLQALGELQPAPSGVVIVVVTRPGEAATLRAPDGIAVVYADRARVELEIGRFGTPAHVWLSEAGTVAGFSVGFKHAGALRPIYAAFTAPLAPVAAKESCGEACGQQ